MEHREGENKKVTTSLTVRLLGILPEKVPVHVMAELFDAVQTLCAKDLRLKKILRTSAAYQLHTKTVEPSVINEAIRNCVLALSDPENHLVSTMLGAFDTIERIIGSLGCESMQIFSEGMKKADKLSLKYNAWTSIRSRFILEDEATVIGQLRRVGGASLGRCQIRVPFQKQLLYCPIRTEGVAQRMAKHLYEDVELHGRGLFFTRDWKLLKFRVHEFKVRKNRTYEESYKAIRESGGAAWDLVPNVQQAVEDMR
jgi:hypothetical protein